MLYKILGATGSGASLTILDRVVNSKYSKVLYLTAECPVEVINTKLKAYTINTNKIIVNNIVVKSIPYGEVTDDALEILLDEYKDKNYDCIIIDPLRSISCADGECVIDVKTYYEELCLRLSTYSINNDMDIIIRQSINRDYIKKSFDETMELFSDNDLVEGQENVLVYKSYMNEVVPFVKIYEQRNNLIRSININKYFMKESNIEK